MVLQATTGHGDPLHYDSLILATGARQYIAVPGALTYRGSQDSPAFSRILAEALSGDIKTLAFVVPSSATWPLPLYELALQTATKLAEEEIEVEIRLLTPEEAPLGVFGHSGSEVVATGRPCNCSSRSPRDSDRRRSR